MSTSVTAQEAIRDGAAEDARQGDPDGHLPEGCLDEQAVLDFAAGLVPPQRLSDVEGHLAGCEHCAELVVLAAAPQGALAPTPYARSATSRSRNAAALLQPDMALNDTYRIIRFVGEGGMGEVYEVSHARLAGRYAAKVLSLDLATNEQAFSRFRREAVIASGLSHRNIVQVIDFSELEDGRPFLVMEFLDGHDLGQILSGGPLSLDRSMRLVEQVVSALSELHAHRIVHRDLKPQNIFVLPGKDGDLEQVKLVDFGLAKRASPSMVVTQERSLLGTPQYMAPEQALGKADSLGPEADQFALAALVHEMLSGKPAFGGDALSTVLYLIVHEMPQPLRELVPNLPASLYAALERGLAKAPEARFPSIKAFFHELQSTAPIAVAARVGKQDSPRARGRRGRWMAGAVAALLTTMGSAALLRTRIRRPVQSPPPAAVVIEPTAARREATAVPLAPSLAGPKRPVAGLTMSNAQGGTVRRPAGGKLTAGAVARARVRPRPEERPRPVAPATDSAASVAPTSPPAPAPRPPPADEGDPLIETL